MTNTEGGTTSDHNNNKIMQQKRHDEEDTTTDDNNNNCNNKRTAISTAGVRKGKLLQPAEFHASADLGTTHTSICGLQGLPTTANPATSPTPPLGRPESTIKVDQLI